MTGERTGESTFTTKVLIPASALTLMFTSISDASSTGSKEGLESHSILGAAAGVSGSTAGVFSQDTKAIAAKAATARLKIFFIKNFN